jgi:hypothetical protein
MNTRTPSAVGALHLALALLAASTVCPAAPQATQEQARALAYGRISVVNHSIDLALDTPPLTDRSPLRLEVSYRIEDSHRQHAHHNAVRATLYQEVGAGAWLVLWHDAVRPATHRGRAREVYRQVGVLVTPRIDPDGRYRLEVEGHNEHGSRRAAALLQVEGGAWRLQPEGS